MTRFSPTDHLRHKPDETGRMRDSLFWQTTMAENRLGMQAYLYLTAAGKAGFNVCLWGEDRKPLLFDRVEGTVPESMDLDDFRLEGLSLKKTHFGGPARVRYESARVTMEFTFTGDLEPFSYHDNPDGLPSWFAMNRYEQTGRMVGTIKAGDRIIAIDHIAHRDHSWGNRNWGMPQHWKWFVIYSDDGTCAINGWIWIARGEWGVAGYVTKGATQRAIRAISHHAEYDPDMSQRRLLADIVDVDGRATRITLERFGLVKLPTGDKLGTIIQEAACTGTIDGAPASGQFETHWQQAYIDYLAETGSWR
ncbi:MAG TPA: hypothetical protein PKE25_01685 [Novosphingobium sp.]|nr:hypothetical protein [Novosphingobium sp.]